LDRYPGSRPGPLWLRKQDAVWTVQSWNAIAFIQVIDEVLQIVSHHFSAIPVNEMLELIDHDHSGPGILHQHSEAARLFIFGAPFGIRRS
jgi:hypothetical protein